ncbi:MAG: fasciclin domain-containing protein [Candidatus Kapaibacterium sp.]|nr:MAG: fasciclin domain-containing protein [Candidatus Kapabacteria bacterium]
MFIVFVASCSKEEEGAKSEEKASEQLASGGQENVKDEESKPDIVKVAVGSKDHSTLVTALKAANLVTSMSNAGPFTVFAPTNAAFDKLPAGTVETLLKPENKAKLADILYHHVMTSALDVDFFSDGQTLTMFDGKPAKITKKDGAMYIDDAKVVASVRASNGVVHVIDAVVLAK